MHTIKILAFGFLLLGASLLVGRLIGNGRGMSAGAVFFIPLWLIVSGVNMYFGIKRAGYTFREELPIFLFVFLLPALPAFLVWWMREPFSK